MLGSQRVGHDLATKQQYFAEFVFASVLCICMSHFVLLVAHFISHSSPDVDPQ